MPINAPDPIQISFEPHNSAGFVIRNGPMMVGRRSNGSQARDTSAPANTCIQTWPVPEVLVSNFGFQGGAVANNAGIRPIFWGSAWNDPNTELRPAEIWNALEALLASGYFCGLKQYGVTPGPLGPALIVTSPGTTTDIPGDLLWNLVGNHFPNSEDPGGRNIYVVFLPQGAQLPIQASGAHSSSTRFDTVVHPLHTIWYAWISFAGNVSGTMTTVSHELAESLTNPEDNGWRVPNAEGDISEIGDVCVPYEGTTNGVAATAYCSKVDNACIIPQGFSVRLFLKAKGIDGTNGIRSRVPPGQCLRAWLAG